MFEIIGKYNRAQVFANQVHQASYAQVLQMCNRGELRDSQMRRGCFPNAGAES